MNQHGWSNQPMVQCDAPLFPIDETQFHWLTDGRLQIKVEGIDSSRIKWSTVRASDVPFVSNEFPQNINNVHLALEYLKTVTADVIPADELRQAVVDLQHNVQQLEETQALINKLRVIPIRVNLPGTLVANTYRTDGFDEEIKNIADNGYGQGSRNQVGVVVNSTYEHKLPIRSPSGSKITEPYTGHGFEVYARIHWDESGQEGIYYIHLYYYDPTGDVQVPYTQATDLDLVLEFLWFSRHATGIDWESYVAVTDSHIIDQVPGPAGTDGNEWLPLDHDPLPAEGKPGDFAINVDTQHYFHKSDATTWDFLGTLGGVVQEAPNDGLYYVRSAHSWKAIDRLDLKVGASTGELDFSKEQVFNIDASQNVTITFTNTPPATRSINAVVTFTGNAGTITWPQNIKWADGEPVLGSDTTIVVLFWSGTFWAGATWMSIS